jgi:hypothetical protein
MRVREKMNNNNKKYRKESKRDITEEWYEMLFKRMREK